MQTDSLLDSTWLKPASTRICQRTRTRSVLT